MNSVIDNEIIKILKRNPILLSPQKILSLANKKGSLRKMSLQSLTQYLKQMIEDKKIGMVKIRSRNRYCELHLQEKLAEKEGVDIKRCMACNSSLDSAIESREEDIALLENNIINEKAPLVCEIRSLEQQIQQMKNIKEPPHILENTTMLVFLIIGAVLFFIPFACFCNGIELDLIVGLIFILSSLVFLIPVIIYLLKTTRQSKANKKKMQTLENSLSQLLTIDEQAVKFYNECTKIISEGEKETETISIVGQKYGFYDINQAHSYYKKGESERKRQMLIEAYESRKAAREEEQKSIAEMCEKKTKTGKEKYLVILRKWLKLILSQKKVAQGMKELSKCNANYRERDWAITGGIASALGGTGLGVASAIDTQLKNEKEKEIAHALSRKQSSIAFDIECSATSEEKGALKYLQLMEEVLIDEQNIDAKFKLLKYTDIRIGLTRGQNLFVSMTLKCSFKPKPKILSKPAIFDGVLKISVFDKENNVVSTGYYIADGFEDYNYQYAGFKAEEKVKVICPLDSPVNIEELRCEITPEALWFIESNQQIFKVPNSEIINEYNAYKKVYTAQATEVLLNL